MFRGRWSKEQEGTLGCQTPGAAGDLAPLHQVPGGSSGKAAGAERRCEPETPSLLGLLPALPFPFPALPVAPVTSTSAVTLPGPSLKL